MIRSLLLILALLLGGCVHPTASHGPVPTPAATRAMTYNIRLDLASDGANDWAHRRDRVVALIARESPDLLGLQEVLLRQKRDLEAALPGYALVGVARDDGRILSTGLSARLTTAD